MTSYFGIPLFRLAIILLLSVLFKLLVPKRVHDTLVPWCFAGLIAHGNLVPFIGGVPHFFLLMLYFIEMAIVLDGYNLNYLKCNRVWGAFLVFWGYLTITSFWCDSFYGAFTWWLSTLVELLMVGYYAGMWALRTPDGIRKLFVPTAVIGLLSVLIYFKYGFGSELDASGRGVLDATLKDRDMGTNVNAIGLAVAPIVVVMGVLIVTQFDQTRKGRLFKLVAIITFLVSAYVLIRTGSRNACLVFFPAGYFVYKSLRFTKRKGKVLLLVGVVVALLSTIVMKKLKDGTGSVRAFTLMQDGGKFDIYGATSGRWYEYESFLYKVEGIGLFFGKGADVEIDETGEVGVGGALSAYVTLLKFSGIFGLFLLFVYFMVMYFESRRMGIRGQIAMLLFLSWALTGLGEAGAIRRGHALRLLQGVSIAFCSRMRFKNPGGDWRASCVRY